MPFASAIRHCARERIIVLYNTVRHARELAIALGYVFPRLKVLIDRWSVWYIEEEGKRQRPKRIGQRGMARR